VHPQSKALIDTIQELVQCLSTFKQTDLPKYLTVSVLCFTKYVDSPIIIQIKLMKYIGTFTIARLSLIFTWCWFTLGWKLRFVQNVFFLMSFCKTRGDYNSLNCFLFLISDKMNFSVRCVVVALGILMVSVKGLYGKVPCSNTPKYTLRAQSRFPVILTVPRTSWYFEQDWLVFSINSNCVIFPLHFLEPFNNSK